MSKSEQAGHGESVRRRSDTGEIVMTTPIAGTEAEFVSVLADRIRPLSERGFSLLLASLLLYRGADRSRGEDAEIRAQIEALLFQRTEVRQ